MKKKFLVILCLLCLTLTGCTSYLRDSKGNVVTEKSNGQSLVSNILCKPENEDVLKTYEKNYKESKNSKNSKSNAVDVNKLPSCSSFTITSGGYEGIWSSVFIKPLSFFIIRLGILFKNYGIAIIVVTLIIRFIIFPISRKSALQSEGMKLAQKDLDKLQEKYRGRTSTQDQQSQAAEMMAIYKKYNINPMSGCLFSFIQMPLFFAFLESLYRIPAVFEGEFLNFNLGTSPFNALFGSTLNFSNFAKSFTNGNIFYILLPILVGLTTYYSFKYNGSSEGDSEQARQMRTTMNIMLVFIIIMSFQMSTSIIIYWITGSLFTIIQAIIIRNEKEKAVLVGTNKTISYKEKKAKKEEKVDKKISDKKSSKKDKSEAKGRKSSNGSRKARK